MSTRRTAEGKPKTKMLASKRSSVFVIAIACLLFSTLLCYAHGSPSASLQPEPLREEGKLERIDRIMSHFDTLLSETKVCKCFFFLLVFPYLFLFCYCLSFSFLSFARRFVGVHSSWRHSPEKGVLTLRNPNSPLSYLLHVLFTLKESSVRRRCLTRCYLHAECRRTGGQF